MYEKVAVIGLGSLGGFVCDNIAKVSSIKELTIIDPDIVKDRNLRNSIYTPTDVGKSKAEVLEEIIERTNKNLKVNKICERFLEGQTEIGKHDLVIDCRDFTYDRGKEVDVRLFISSMYLVVDCRKNVKYHKAYEGNYDLNIQKVNIIDAANFTASLIQKGLLADLVKKQSLYTVEIDYIDRVVKESLQKGNSPDIIFDETMTRARISNLIENVIQIVEMNKKSDIQLFLGNKKSPVVSKLIEQFSLNTPQDVDYCLSSMIKLPFKNTFYFVKIDPKNFLVEIIPETAAA